MDLKEVSELVSREVENYVYQYSEACLGQPWSKEKIERQLSELRGALLDPYWADVIRKDTAEQIKAFPPVVSRCAVVTEARGGYVVAFDPLVREFLLVGVFEDGSLQSLGVPGDLVGCFMAR